MGLTPIPPIPSRRSELDIYRDSITPKKSTEHLLFHLIPVFCVIALIVLAYLSLR